MEVISLLPHGFCLGVVKAIDLALKVAKENPDRKIGVLGMIVHNSYVVDTLKKHGIISYEYSFNNVFEVIDRIDADIVILTAHGTRLDIVNRLKERGIEVKDATCSYVFNTYKLIVDELKNNHEVVYIGIKITLKQSFLRVLIKKGFILFLMKKISIVYHYLMNLHY